ncbi:hypothetical protein, partial [Sphingobacterium multivorum]|uniref:hypothetical protein n=1 Tax=Sphingobacterium multivorum TaxID=28454 RepID=UPI00289DB2BD
AIFNKKAASINLRQLLFHAILYVFRCHIILEIQFSTGLIWLFEHFLFYWPHSFLKYGCYRMRHAIQSFV